MYRSSSSVARVANDTNSSTSPSLVAAAHEHTAKMISPMLAQLDRTGYALSTRAERAGIAREPGDDTAQLVWMREPPERVRFGGHCLCLGIVIKIRGHPESILGSARGQRKEEGALLTAS